MPRSVWAVSCGITIGKRHDCDCRDIVSRSRSASAVGRSFDFPTVCLALRPALSENDGLSAAQTDLLPHLRSPPAPGYNEADFRPPCVRGPAWSTVRYL